MRYLGRLLLYGLIFWCTLSVCLVVAYRYLPIPITPLKLIRLVEYLPQEGIRVDSRWVSLSKIDPSMPLAVVATEDNHFLNHHGFDWEAIRKAFKENQEGDRIRGGSTISQQTAKNVFCPPHRTWIRKGVESYFTLLIELVWGKERIMEVYLNVIETGMNRYGVEATARRVYNKHASELNRYEASMIATVLPSPLRMRVESPSSYMVGRAARVRYVMRQLPALDFENPAPIEQGK